MKRLIQDHPTLTIACAAILLTIITFGALIPQLGFYQDDWYLIWSGQTRGAASIIDLFAGDRPFMGYIYSYEYRVLGNSLLGWHLYALLFKVLGVLGVLALFKQLWPKQTRTMVFALLIFIVYPGFLSQPIANTFQNHLLTYAAAIWSIAVGVAAIQAADRRRRMLYTLISLALTTLYLPIYEYMIGLEAVKMVLFGLAIQQREGSRFRQTARNTALRYLPHGVIATLFVYWRFFLFESTRPTTNQANLLSRFAGNPVRSLLYLMIDTGKDFIDTVVHAWSAPSYRLYATALNRELGEAVLWAIPAMIISLALLRWFAASDPHQENDRKDLVLLGLWAVIVSLIPVTFSGREVLFNGFERYTLQASLGVSLLLAGILSYVRPKMDKALLLGLVFIGVTTHILNAGTWANVWEKHRNLYWQIAWRVPAFKEDTLVIVSNFSIEQDYEAWVPLNLIYAPLASSPVIDTELMYAGAVPDIQAGNPVQGSGRIEHVKNFDNVVIFTKPSTLSCLHVIDGELPVLSTFESALVANVAAYSDLDQIESRSNQTIPPDAVFGSEPKHSWCYYYQKISLARQTYDWQGILAWAAQAEAQNLRPTDLSEWMPVFEALVNSGEIEAAYQPASILRSDGDLKISICNALIENEETLVGLAGYDYGNVLTILCTEWDE